ncbi:MAG: hypothetical protein AAFX86_02355 [Pseudomonadota bacterium]
MTEDNEFKVRPLTEEEANARGKRNFWLALALVAFVAMVLAITIIRLSQGTGMADGGF